MTDKTWKVEIRKNCKMCGNPLPTKRHRTYCSEQCRNKRNYLTVRNKMGREAFNERQRKYLYLQKIEDPRGKIQCKICGKWYRQVGTHIVQVHKITAREYRKAYGFDVKRGQLPDDLREHKAEQVFDNGTVNNLKVGKKFWFKKGQEGVGVYERSAQTMERLKVLGKNTKRNLNK